MAKKIPPRPTEGELEILRVLWQRGPSTVRQVREGLSGDREVGYTTVLKMMQIMHGKGLLSRDESRRTHVYSPAVPQERTLRQLARDLLERAFNGSAEKLVMHALQGREVSERELATIRKLLDDLEERKQ